MLSCFVCMVNELPPRFLFYTEKKISLARFRPVLIQMKHSMKDRGKHASTLEKYIHYCMVIM